jgi:hypothetical protein
MFTITPLPAGEVDTDAPVTRLKLADGPVFVHARGCEAFESVPGAISEQVDGRVLSIRAYDGDAMMTTASVLKGEEFRDRATELLADPGVAFLHVHFAGPGCLAFRVDRA